MSDHCPRIACLASSSRAYFEPTLEARSAQESGLRYGGKGRAAQRYVAHEPSCHPVVMLKGVPQYHHHQLAYMMLYISRFDVLVNDYFISTIYGQSKIIKYIRVILRESHYSQLEMV